MTAATSRDIKVTTPSDREITVTREFDAPRDLVFLAHSSAEHMSKWWGPRRYDIAVCEVDFRVGGKWRIVHRGDDGQEFGFRGEYKEIRPPEKIVWTFEFEGYPGHISLETLSLEERDGKTILTANAVYETVEDRNATLQSGMEEGANETMQRLDEYIATLRS
ncbi:MAG TPA: SRPBCC family protein [Actinomycetota bacterium]|nr:SRPBCC family protein [Actinomycetota bacterium]